MHSFNALDLRHVGTPKPTPGTIVFTVRLGLIRTYGIVSDWLVEGRPCVIAGSARTGRISEQTWQVFSQGNRVHVGCYPDACPAREILRQARSLLGSRYDSLSWHGRHIAMFAYGVEPKRSFLGTVWMAVLTALPLGR